LGVFAKDADKTLRPTLESIEKYLDIPPEHLLHVNVGTSEEPEWRYRQGTSLVELFNRFCNALHLERFSQEVGAALVTLLAYSFSHTQRINFKQMSLEKHMRDPTLMNDLIIQQRSLQSKGWLCDEHVLFHGVSDLKPMEKRSEFLTGLSHPLGSFMDKAVNFLQSGERNDLPKHVSKKFEYRRVSCTPSSAIRAVRPFETKQERALLRSMLGDRRFYHNNQVDAVFKDGHFHEELLFQNASRGHLDAMINCQQLCWDWNINFLVDEDAEVSWGAFRVDDPSQIFAKEVSHFKIELERLAGIASQRMLPDDAKSLVKSAHIRSDVPLPPSLAPPAADAVASAGASVGETAPPCLPREDPLAVNHTVPLPPPPPPPPGKPRSRKSGEESINKKMKEDKPIQKCPEPGCAKGRHEAADQCPFNRWKNDFPKTPREGAENQPAAHRRIWPQCRAKFVVEDASNKSRYVRPSPSCTYMGVLPE